MFNHHLYVFWRHYMSFGVIFRKSSFWWIKKKPWGGFRHITVSGKCCLQKNICILSMNKSTVRVILWVLGTYNSDFFNLFLPHFLECCRGNICCVHNEYRVNVCRKVNKLIIIPVNMNSSYLPPGNTNPKNEKLQFLCKHKELRDLFWISSEGLTHNVCGAC